MSCVRAVRMTCGTGSSSSFAIPVAHRPDGIDLGRIGVRDGETAKAAVGIDDVHRAPVGQPRHRQAGRGRQRSAEVERRGQHLAHLRQEGHLLPRRLRVPASGTEPRDERGQHQAGDPIHHPPHRVPAAGQVDRSRRWRREEHRAKHHHRQRHEARPQAAVPRADPDDDEQQRIERRSEVPMQRHMPQHRDQAGGEGHAVAQRHGGARTDRRRGQGAHAFRPRPNARTGTRSAETAVERVSSLADTGAPGNRGDSKGAAGRGFAQRPPVRRDDGHPRRRRRGHSTWRRHAAAAAPALRRGYVVPNPFTASGLPGTLAAVLSGDQ